MILTEDRPADHTSYVLSLPALKSIDDPKLRETVGDLIKEGNSSFYRRGFNLALRKFEDAFKKIEDYPENDRLKLTVKILLGNTYFELHQFDKANDQFVTVSKQPLDKKNKLDVAEEDRSVVSATDLWIKLAKVLLAKGDGLYRAAANDVEARFDEIVESYNLILSDGLQPNEASPLYKESLWQMIEDVRRVVRAITRDQEKIDDINPQIVALVFDCRRRFKQLAVSPSLNFFGYEKNYVPILRYRHLRDVARSFAQTAAQANREYVAYMEKVQNETFTLRQLEQAVEVNRSGVAIEASAAEAARLEANAAQSAVRLARLRRDNAREYRDIYAETGYEIALLETALSWAQSNAVHQDEQIQLQYEGLENLGIERRYQPRSHLIHELTWERARRTYALQNTRLRQQAEELSAAVTQAARQQVAADARTETARLRHLASQARLRHSIKNLNDVRTREFGIEFFSDVASLVRETADIYLQHAMLIAFMMERAYAFETGRETERIRLDYGDLDGAKGFYAADILQRDIDSFEFQRIVEAKNKIQPAIRTLSLAKEYPLEFLMFLGAGDRFGGSGQSSRSRKGQLRFSTLLEDFQDEHPGIYNGRIKSVIVKPIGLIGSRGPIGRLTVNNVSWFRTIDGIPKPKFHAAEAILLSSFDARRDSLFVAGPQEQLDVFENVGLGTDWLLEIPQSRNSFEISRITDIIFTITYLCEVDAELTQQDIDRPRDPAEAETRYSLKTDFKRDAFYHLEATERLDFEISADRLPRNHRDPKLRALRLIAINKNNTPIPLKVRFWSSVHGSENDAYETNENEITVVLAEDDTTGHHDKPLIAEWSIILKAEDNPLLRADESGRRKLNLRNVKDLFLVAGYAYTRQ